MTELVLVRHGQASFGKSDYDVLSPIGIRQSSVLGAHWKQTGFSAEAFYSGAMARQKDTAAGVLADAGIDAPVTENPAFNEYDFESILRGYLPLAAQEHPQLKLTSAALFQDRSQFQVLFEILIGYWLAGRAITQPPIESWQVFRARVVEGLREIATPDRKRMVLFTSGGVISVALREALQLNDAMAFHMNVRIANASVHHFRVGKRGLSLLGFNNITHLELARDPSLLTFR